MEKCINGVGQQMLRATVAVELLRYTGYPRGSDWLVAILETDQLKSGLRAAADWLHLVEHQCELQQSSSQQGVRELSPIKLVGSQVKDLRRHLEYCRLKNLGPNLTATEVA